MYVVSIGRDDSARRCKKRDFASTKLSRGRVVQRENSALIGGAMIGRCKHYHKPRTADWRVIPSYDVGLVSKLWRRGANERPFLWITVESTNIRKRYELRPYHCCARDLSVFVFRNHGGAGPRKIRSCRSSHLRP
ncbi:hypothetical protein NOR53_929 [gamma proteobacterium NOR5-3]|nr:hypothetical protein NOR53_929 [gamma proteobacterium NOR5-3]